LDLASNDFHGENTHSICSTTIMQLILANNHFNGTIPSCIGTFIFVRICFKSFVIFCSDNEHKKKKKKFRRFTVKISELNNNELHGTIPKTLYFLSGLGPLF